MIDGSVKLALWVERFLVFPREDLLPDDSRRRTGLVVKEFPLLYAEDFE